MKLLGWVNELAPYIVQAISDGKLTIHLSKDKTHEYLVGKCDSPSGYVVEFQ